MQHLARGRRERHGVARQGHPRHRFRPPQAALFETREGEKRTVYELDVDEIGLRCGTDRQVTALRAVAAVAASVRAAAAVRRRASPWRTRTRRAVRLGGSGGAGDEPPSEIAHLGVIHGKTKGRKPRIEKVVKAKACSFCKDKGQVIDYKDTALCVGSCRTAARFGRVG